MAVAETPAPRNRDWKKRESFTSAMIQVVIVGAVLAVAVYFFYVRTTRRKDIADRLKDARQVALRDNPADLAKATLALDEIFKIDDSARDALALAADIETERWVVHGVPGAEQKAKDFLRKAEEEESRSEDRYGSKVLQLIAEGKATEAAQYAEELRKKGASSAKLWFGIAQAYEAQGSLALARAAYVNATEKGWKNARFYAGFGEAMIDQADYRMAVDVLGKGLKANGDHIRTKLDLALALIYRGDRVKEAADAIKEVLAMGDELTPGLKARALATEAELANFEQRPDDAIKSADQALSLDQHLHFALVAKARALAAKKDAGAQDAFKAAVAANPTAAGTYFMGAGLLQQAGNHEGAMALLDSYEQFFSKVQLTDSEGKTHPAIDRDDKFFVARGDILRAAGKLDEAMTNYDRAIAINSVSLARAHFAKGALLLEKKDYDQALEELDLVTPVDGTGQIAEAYEAKGQVLFAKKDFVNGCQNFAFALTRMRGQQPKEKLSALLDDVSKQLVQGGQKAMSKAWEQEAKPLIQ